MTRDQIIARVRARIGAVSPIEENAKAVKHSNAGLFVVIGLCAGVYAIGKLK